MAPQKFLQSAPPSLESSAIQRSSHRRIAAPSETIPLRILVTLVAETLKM